MAANYVLLEKITLSAASASSVTFSNIPQTGYTDLVVKVNARGSTNNTYDNLQLKFNGVSLSYTDRHLVGPGNGIAVSSGTNAYTTSSYVGTIPALTATATTFGNTEIYIPNYTSANFKAFSSDSADERNVTTGVWSALIANLWSNTAAITTIQLLASGGDFVQHSTFYLYGVAKQGTTPSIAPYATGGDEIMLVGSYWYHIFTSNGTFAVNSGLTPTLAVTACGGGGGGGFSMAGGGGGGELDILTSVASATGSYAVTVGAKGVGQWNVSSPYGTNGGTSTFVQGATTYVSSLGGGAAGMQGAGYQVGLTGGSGGGGNGRETSAAGGGASGSNTFAGGSGYWGGGGGPWAGGGGGGATAAGTNASSTKGGDGGQGYQLTAIDSNLTAANFASFSGMTYISSGGGGASGNGTSTASTSGTGAGISENHTTSRVPTSATSYGSGAGGLGGNYGAVATNGFQGVVIVRYPV